MKLSKLTKVFQRKAPKRLNATAVSRRVAEPIEDYDEEPQTKLWSALVVVFVLHVVAVGGIYAFNSIKAHRKGSEPTPVTVVAADPAAAPVSAAPVTTAPVATTPVARVEPNIAPISNGRIHHVKEGETAARIAALYGVQLVDLEEVNGARNIASLRAGQALNIPKAKAVAARTEDVSRVPAQAVAKATPAVVAKATTPTAVVKATTPTAVAKATTPTAVVKATPTAVTKATPAVVAKPGATYKVAQGDNVVGISKKLGVSSAELLKLNQITDPRKLQIGQVLKVPAKKTTP